MSRSIKVLKFGGTSLGTVDRIKSVTTIIANAATDFTPLVVVSAMGGVTDELEKVASEPDRALAEDRIHELLFRHMTYARELLPAEERTNYLRTLEGVRVGLFRRISLGASSEVVRDEILAAGERLSAPLVAARLRASGLKSSAWDAASLVRTDSSFGEAVLDWVRTRETIQRWHAGLEDLPVVTGFIGSDGSGRTTTLGRGGSDYSAAIFASALHAEVLERWTDVDGIYTSDPAIDRTAERLEQLDSEEAESWNQLGKIGMHRDALEPVSRGGIPVHVRSTFAPDREGTWILPGVDKRHKRQARR